MHPYEKHIIMKLAQGPAGRYRDLRPEKAESNLFIYHLKKLMQGGFIEKNGGKYILTPLGLRHVDKLSMTNLEPRFQPKIVTLIILKNKKGEYLVYKRARQPFYGMTAFPYGKIHFGDKIYEAAKRELKEKSGISAELSRAGDAYITIREKGSLITHMFCHVFTGLSQAEPKETEYGFCKWQKPEKFPKGDFVPGFLKIFRLVQKGKNFFDESEHELK